MDKIDIQTFDRKFRQEAFIKIGDYRRVKYTDLFSWKVPQYWYVGDGAIYDDFIPIFDIPTILNLHAKVNTPLFIESCVLLDYVSFLAQLSFMVNYPDSPYAKKEHDKVIDTSFIFAINKSSEECIILIKNDGIFTTIFSTPNNILLKKLVLFQGKNVPLISIMLERESIL